MGKVGDVPIGHDHDLKFLSYTGYAHVNEVQSTTCTYDMQRCYQAMAVPVIFDKSVSEGYKTGHQNLTLHGYGFNEHTVVTVGNATCIISYVTEDQISCEIQP